MKYQVELLHESYIMYEVEADNVEEAKDKAWNMLHNDAEAVGVSGQWNINHVEEVEDETDN